MSSVKFNATFVYFLEFERYVETNLQLRYQHLRNLNIKKIQYKW